MRASVSVQSEGEAQTGVDPPEPREIDTENARPSHRAPPETGGRRLTAITHRSLRLAIPQGSGRSGSWRSLACLWARWTARRQLTEDHEGIDTERVEALIAEGPCPRPHRDYPALPHGSA